MRETDNTRRAAQAIMHITYAMDGLKTLPDEKFAGKTQRDALMIAVGEQIRECLFLLNDIVNTKCTDEDRHMGQDETYRKPYPTKDAHEAAERFASDVKRIGGDLPVNTLLFLLRHELISTMMSATLGKKEAE